MLSGLAIQALQMRALADSPLSRREQVVRQEFASGPKPQPQLNTAVFTRSPGADYIAEVKSNVLHRQRPDDWLPHPLERQHSSSGSFLMAADDAIRVRMEFGALMWMRVERGAPGIGTTINVVA